MKIIAYHFADSYQSKVVHSERTQVKDNNIRVGKEVTFNDVTYKITRVSDEIVKWPDYECYIVWIDKA